jgi:DNA processing protein
MSACSSCLQRSVLIARLSGRIEILRREQRYVRKVLELPDDQLIAAVGGTVVLDALPSAPSAAETLLSACQAAAITMMCRHDDAYPPALLEDPSAPAVLYLAGSQERWSALAGSVQPERPPVVAVVGTRKASADGLEMARRLGRELSVAGVTVVSGMALGIDSAAHDGALAGGGRTVAVLAGSADVAYPRRRHATHAELIERAAVVSEMPPGAPVFAWNFLARNRIIAGLADATIVVEAAERSGSLVTAEMAIDLGREVGAVPGTPINWRASGANELLRDGALLVREAADVLDRLLGPARASLPLPTPCLTPSLAAVLDDVQLGVGSVSSLAPRHGGAAAVQAALMDLELQGHVIRIAGGRFVPAGDASAS